MSDIFDTWKQLSFGGIVFPFTDIQIKGALRHHAHEFIKRPGAEVETLARRSYQITVKSEMIDSIIPVASFARYVDLYPSRLSALVSLCEQGDAHDLFIPNMGRPLTCKATDWTRSITAARRSGESVDFSFLEDSTAQYTTLNLIGATSAALVPSVNVLRGEVAALNDPVALDRIDRLIATLSAYLDAKDRITDAIEYQTARIDAVIGRCLELATLPILGNPIAARANTALLRFWSVAIQVRDVTNAVSRPLLGYVTERPDMSIIDISLSLFGDTSNAFEILRDNDFDDAMSIPFGTFIRYRAAA